MRKLGIFKLIILTMLISSCETREDVRTSITQGEIVEIRQRRFNQCANYATLINTSGGNTREVYSTNPVDLSLLGKIVRVQSTTTYKASWKELRCLKMELDITVISKEGEAS